MKKSIIPIIFIALILLSSFSAVVSAEVTYGSGQKVVMPSFLKDAITGWSLGNIDPGFAKIIIFLIVFLLIFLLTETIFGTRNRWIMIILSIAVSILATVTIKPGEVNALLLNYNALGLTITMLLPLMLLLGLSYRATRPNSDISLVIIQYIAWIGFVLFSLYKVIWAFYDTKPYEFGVIMIVLAMTILAAIMALFNRQILAFISRRAERAETDRARSNSRRATQRERDLARAERDMGEALPEE